MASNEEREAPLDGANAALQQLPPESRATLDPNVLAFIQRIEAERDAEREGRVAAEERAAAAAQLNAGTYYATFDEVWNGIGEPYSNRDYKRMIRRGLPTYRRVATKRILQPRFQVTHEEAIKEVTEMAYSATAATTLATKLKKEIWPVNVLHSKLRDRNNLVNFIRGEGVTQDDNINDVDTPVPVKSGDIAHLVPASSKLAALYHHVAIWVFGNDVLNNAPKVVQKMIQGSYPEEGKNDVSSKKLAPKKVAPKKVAPKKVAPKNVPPKKVPPKKGPARIAKHPPPGGSVQSPGMKSETRQRVPHTGLKHMICNKIKLAGQADYFVKNPCIIIVPVLSLEQAKNWQGEGYDAILMLSTGKKKQQGSDEELASVSSTSQDTRDTQSLQAVAGAVGMTFLGKAANEVEINLAKKLLKAAIKGLACSLMEKSKENDEWVQNLTGDSREELRQLQGPFSRITGEKGIIVPDERQGNVKPVRKVTFAPAFDFDENDGHPAPDPLLLVVRAAVNWSWFHEQKLLAAVELKDSFPSEESLVEMEAFLDRKRSYGRARQDKIITNMEIIYQMQSACS